VLLVAQLAGLAAVSAWVVGDDLHQAPVAVVAPAVVGQSLAERAATAPGRPVEVVRARDVEQARTLAVDGDVAGAVLVDLARQRDVLLLPRRADPALRAVVAGEVRATSARLGRTVRVEDVGPGLDAAGRAAVVLVPVVAVLAGLVTSGVVTLRSGRLPRSWAGARRRLRTVAAVSLVAGVALGAVGAQAAGGALPAWCGVGVLLVLTGALVSQALEHLLDVWGWGLAVGLLVLTALPDLVGTGPWFQPVPWRELTSLLPHAAGIQALQELTGGSSVAPWRPFAVLAAWLAAAGLTSTLARRERAAAAS
jgi:hypothetical protein